MDYKKFHDPIECKFKGETVYVSAIELNGFFGPCFHTTDGFSGPLSELKGLPEDWKNLPETTIWKPLNGDGEWNKKPFKKALEKPPIPEYDPMSLNQTRDWVKIE